MEGQPTTPVKQILRKFLYTKNSVAIRSNFKVMSRGFDAKEIKNRDIKTENCKPALECCSNCIKNSFLPTTGGNSLSEMSVSPTTTDVKTMVDGHLMENEHTQRFTIPIVILNNRFVKKVRRKSSVNLNYSECELMCRIKISFSLKLPQKNVVLIVTSE